MSKNVNHIQHVKSNVVENNQPKLPNANILAYGEIAINYADGYETISLKNSGDTVVRFSSDDYYTSQKLGSGFTGANSANTVTSVIEDNERVTATALNELNDAVADIDVELSGKTDNTAFTAHTASTSHMNATEKTNLDSLATNIAAISGITSTKVSNWDTAYTSAHSHSNKSYLDGITGNVGSMAYESTGNYYTTGQTSGSTELSTAFGNKVNNSTFTAHTASTSHMSATEKENLDSLSGNIAAISAITSTKVSNWDTAYTSAHSHSNKSVLDGISSGDITQWNKQFDDAKYELSGTTHVINFYHSGTVKATIDATDFIKDGMVDNVVISGGNLVITFNTDAGKQAITIPLTDIFNPANYYDKTAIDNKLGSGFTGANSGNTVTQVIEDNEEITAAALNTLNDAVADIDAELSGKTDNTAFTTHTASTVHMNSTEKTNLDSLATNIAAISGITSTKVSNWDTAYTSAHNHANMSVISGISASDITNWNGKTDNTAFTAHTASTSHMNATEKTNLDSLSGNIAAISAITSAKVSNWDTAYTNNHTHSNKSVIDGISASDITNWNGKTDNTAFTAHTASTSHMSSTEKTNLDSLSGNIAAISAITSTKVSNWDTAYSNNHTHSNKSYLDGITGTVGTMAYASTGNYYTTGQTSGSTELSTAFGNKADQSAFTAHTANTTAHITAAERTAWNAKADKTYVDDKLGSAFTGANSGVSVTKYVEDNELVISNALNVLNAKIKEPLVETTYANLVTLRNDSGLTPGAKYRITDFVTTTTQENTQSAGHAFDIIVEATDVNVLNENAMAIKHSGDTYFANSKLDAWEIKYCLDNNTERFYWADSTNGKGVIYYMKDEFNNECHYDFKNIMFERWYGTGVTTSSTAITEDMVSAMKDVFFDHYHSYQSSNFSLCDGRMTIGIDSSDSKFFYTFSLCSDDGETFESDDNSTVYDGTLKFYGDNMYTNNRIEAYYPFDDGSHLMKLNNIVFKPIDSSADDCYNNVFGKNCYDCTLGFSWTINNTFGNECYYNTFGNEFNNNTFGNSCYSNSFGNDCQYNTFGNECYYNTFGNGCYNNIFGNSCYRNSFGNSCGGNTFGNICYSNSFGNDCGYNSFGNDCQYNTFGNSCGGNTFGNSCNRNSFGNSCGGNTFGNSCNNITFSKDYCWYNIVENGNQYINVTSTETTSSSKLLRNFTIAQGINNSTSVKTISHNTVNDVFKTTYQPQNSNVVSV